MKTFKRALFIVLLGFTIYLCYQKIFFKKTKEKFKQEHPEVARYEKAAAYLAKHPDDKDSTQKELQEEQETLLSEIAELKVPLTEVQEDLKKLRDIRYWVRKATPGTEAVSYTHLREFVEKIVVHECSYDENKTRRQDIEIYYSFVGKVDLPE